MQFENYDDFHDAMKALCGRSLEKVRFLFQLCIIFQHFILIRTHNEATCEIRDICFISIFMAPKLIHNSFHKDWIVYPQCYCMGVPYHLPFSSAHAQHNHINISNSSRYYQSLLLYVTFMACFPLSCLGNPVENYFRILKVPKFAVHVLKT